MRRAHSALLIVAALVCITIGATFTFWISFDSAPPLANAVTRLIEYDPHKNFMEVEFEFDKLRSCYGERKQTLTELGEDPPARAGLSLPTETFTGEALPLGHRVIRRMIELPANRPVNFIYKATWAFSCNFLQVGDNSIYVSAPPLVIKGRL